MPKKDKSIELLGLPPGFTLTQTSGNHLAIHRPDGKLLRAESGVPITVALTPSDWRGRKNEAARIKRALLLFKRQL